MYVQCVHTVSPLGQLPKELDVVKSKGIAVHTQVKQSNEIRIRLILEIRRGGRSWRERWHCGRSWGRISDPFPPLPLNRLVIPHNPSSLSSSSSTPSFACLFLSVSSLHRKSGCYSIGDSSGPEVFSSRRFYSSFCLLAPEFAPLSILCLPYPRLCLKCLNQPPT